MHHKCEEFGCLDSTWRHHIIKEQSVAGSVQGTLLFVHQLVHARHGFVHGCLLACRDAELRHVVGKNAAFTRGATRRELGTDQSVQAAPSADVPHLSSCTINFLFFSLIALTVVKNETHADTDLQCFLNYTLKYSFWTHANINCKGLKLLQAASLLEIFVVFCPDTANTDG